MLREFIFVSFILLSSAQICLNTNWRQNGGKSNDVRCTNSDIAQISAEIAGSCQPGSTHTAQLRVQIDPGLVNRFDIGFYFSQTGGNALDGTNCLAATLSPVAASGQTGNPSDPSGPYSNLDDDQCGDARGGLNTPDIVMVTSSFTFQCQDTDGDGKVNIGYCVSWKNGGNNIPCSDYTDAYPGIRTQCACYDGNIANVLIDSATPTPEPEQCLLGELFSITASEVEYDLLSLVPPLPNIFALLPNIACPAMTSSFSPLEWFFVRPVYVDVNAFNDGCSFWLTNTCSWQSETRMLAWEVPAGNSPTCVPENLLVSQCSMPFEPCLNNSWLLDLSNGGSGKYVIWIFSKVAIWNPEDLFSITCMW